MDSSMSEEALARIEEALGLLMRLGEERLGEGGFQLLVSMYEALNNVRAHQERERLRRLEAPEVTIEEIVEPPVLVTSSPKASTLPPGQPPSATLRRPRFGVAPSTATTTPKPARQPTATSPPQHHPQPHKPEGKSDGQSPPPGRGKEVKDVGTQTDVPEEKGETGASTVEPPPDS